MENEKSFDVQINIWMEPANPAKDFSNQNLIGTSFENMDLSNADFTGAVLKRCSFRKCDLSFADFSNADLYRADMTGAKLYSTLFRGADLTRTVFHGCDLYGIKLFDADVTRTRFDETINTESNAKSREDFEKAAEIYNTLKRSFKDHGQISVAAHYYYKQCVCKRKSNPNLCLRALEYVFIDLLIGYGEKPVRSIYFSLSMIAAFSMLYLFLPYWNMGGIVYKTADANELLCWGKHIFLSLEFSATAFIGANFISWDAFGMGRILASLENLVGVIMVSIILIGFSRKLVRD